jgi:hypothetical protein
LDLALREHCVPFWVIARQRPYCPVVLTAAGGGGEKSKPNAVSTDFYPYLCALKQIHETHQRLQKTLSD